ncbi:hypothetical protein KP509_18G009900 [Ceratopteris richardii]|uniref:Epidermal growth factor receptor substrate 15 n=1 Tax=Ceratopteris richardii TaxID=49495 RepID=A0A8T2SQQ7_CERRI|nr:hypothetical protein KP509_18G009900 [Ceratopteris richardii]
MAAPDLFDAYFRRADVDCDGRISGQEAVAFFQGANLQREVLAKVWQYADKGQTGFLSRPEFYNALRLVTVAQSGRELTPALVNKALSEPTVSQIPAPRIQMVGSPASLSPQTSGLVRPVRPPIPPAQSYAVAPSTQGLRPIVSTSLARSSTLITPAVTTNITADWPANKSSSWPGPGSNNSMSGQVAQTKASLPSQDLFQNSSHTAVGPTSVSQAAVEPDLFGGDVFTAVPVNTQVSALSSQVKAVPQSAHPSVTVPIQTPQSSGLQTSVPRDMFSLEVVSSSPTISITSPKQSQSLKALPEQTERGLVTPMPVADGTKAWPKMTDTVVRRYAKIFFEVDTDKDSKINGVQARDLFLSWKLPREILKQIWDLSDQDHDSMLSLHEFCVALYLMERHREGHLLSGNMSSALFFDDSGVQALKILQPQLSANSVPAWQQNPGVLQAAGPGLQPGSLGKPTGNVSQAVGTSSPAQLIPRGQLHGQVPARAPIAPSGRDGSIDSHTDPAQAPQQKSKAPVLEMDLVNQLPADDQLTLQTRHQEAVDAEKKVFELEKEIMESKEKMEFYRSKMQEIVLFKTRCDNRLAEITERMESGKREVETMTKRYNEKFKHTGESQSRLLADEAAFRDVQERRLELYNYILRIDHGGEGDSFQSRAEKLQIDLDELRKLLNSKCKKIGLRILPTTLAELPNGWKPIAQENAAAWDDDWDKFEDEGSDAAKSGNVIDWEENGHYEGVLAFSATRKDISTDKQRYDADSVDEDVSQSSTITGHGEFDETMYSSSPVHDMRTGETRSADSLTKDTQSHGLDTSWPSENTFADDGGDWASAFSHRSDDADSAIPWERNDSTMKSSGDAGVASEKFGASNTFGFNDAFDMLSSEPLANDGMPSFAPIRTKEKASVFFDNSVPSTPSQNNSSFGQTSSGGFFDESVPNTPFNDSWKSQGHGPDFFRFDSFSSTTHDTGRSSDNYARFDSFSSNAGGPPRRLTSFDDSDPFAGTGPFGSRASRRNSDASSAFG